MHDVDVLHRSIPFDHAPCDNIEILFRFSRMGPSGSLPGGGAGPSRRLWPTSRVSTRPNLDAPCLPVRLGSTAASLSATASRSHPRQTWETALGWAPSRGSGRLGCGRTAASGHGPATGGSDRRRWPKGSSGPHRPWHRGAACDRATSFRASRTVIWPSPSRSPCVDHPVVVQIIPPRNSRI